MNFTSNYYKWFEKIILFITQIFIACAAMASIYVFSSSFTGMMKYFVLGITALTYILVVSFFRDSIKEMLNKLLSLFGKLEVWKMLLIISATLALGRLVCSLFFGFDASVDGDISIYCNIAGMLVQGTKPDMVISHLYGMGVHIAVFELLHIHLTVGTFIAVLIATLVNFISFKELFGKEKAFFVTMFYVLMPSTSLFTMCPTHEIFVYLYISVFIFSLNRFLKENNRWMMIAYIALCSVCTALCTFVNPSGYMLYIIMLLVIVLSSADRLKKLLIVVMIVLSFLGNGFVSSGMDEDQYTTKMNTYNILIHGVNPESLGEQIDMYPEHQVKQYLYNHNMEINHENSLYGANKVLINHYIYLLKNPAVLFKLIVHKFYILYSGVHYPINLANHYGAFNGPVYFVILAINTLMYLFMITVGLVYGEKKNRNLLVNNYHLALLGNLGVTMLCIVVNKYSVYVTMFIYFICMYRSCLGESEDADE